MIRLLIVESQPEIRKGLWMRLTAESDISVIGEAIDCESALKLAMELCPDIVLFDVDLPSADGIAAVSALHALCPKSYIITLSIHDDALSLMRVLTAGATAFVTKAMPTDTLLNTIRQVGQVVN